MEGDGRQAGQQQQQQLERTTIPQAGRRQPNDCNDNTHIMSNTPQAGVMREQVEAGGGHVGHNAAHQAALNAGLMSSTSDSLVNNDFFYDDEFSVPFDANLAEGQEVSLLDSVELQDLLTGLRPGVAADTSQSSDYNSSSDELSELRSEPLFSPTPCMSSQEGVSVSTDSLGGQEGSLQTSNDHSYHFDWTANKDQYMISFDRSPRSDTDSLHESNMTTSWATKSRDSMVHNKTTLGTLSKPAGKVGHGPASGLTTWGCIKLDSTPSPEPSQAQGLTTWGRLKQDSLEKASGGKVRSKSLNDVCRTNSEEREPRNFTRARSAGEAGMVSSHSSGDSSDLAVSSAVRDSPTLYELYQKMRSGSMEGDGAADGQGLHMLTGTWSMSPANSDQSLSPAPTPGDTPRLVSWSTIKDLARQISNTSSQTSSQGKVDAMVGSDYPAKQNASVQTLTSVPNQANLTLGNNISTFNTALKNILKTYPELRELLESKKARLKPKKPEFIKSDLSSSVFSSLNLPDLSFLKPSRGLTQSLQVDPVTMSKGCQHARSVEKQKVKRGGSLDSRCPCRGSRETSPAIRRIRSSSTSSFCSSESGIDAGSYESSMRRTHSSDQGFSSQNSQSMSDLDKPQYCLIPYQGFVCAECHDDCMALAQVKGQVCSMCEKTMVAVGHKAMSSSLPGYLQKLPEDQQLPSELPLDLLHVLSNNKVLQCRCEVASLNTRQMRNMEICVDQNDGKPLKSCLVKRHCKGKVLARQRSLSDPYDLAVMKYSQEGQTRYQLITHHAECVHGLSRKGVTTAAVVDEGPMRGDCKHRPGCTMTPPNSPDLIPLMPCACQGNSSCCQSDDTPDTGDNSDQPPHHHRAKKSVSFSEEISYHSPYNSPHESPRKQSGSRVMEHGGIETQCCCILPPPTPGKPVAELSVSDDMLEVDMGDAPPLDFTVSPSASPRPSPPPQGDAPPTPTDTTISQKKAMVLQVVKGAEHIVAYFSSTRDHMEKMELGDSSQSPNIGCLVLRQLCPAMYALLQDGLKPHTHSIFGKVRNSVWGFVEESAKIGSCQPGCSIRVVGELVTDLHKLEFLSTNWLKFNAFIFALMNHKALDYWLSWLQGQESLLLKHYTSASFMVASRTATARHLFLDLTTALQPLAQLPFRLEYNFEFRLVQEQQHQRLVDQLLDKHVSSSLEETLTLPTQRQGPQDTGHQAPDSLAIKPNTSDEDDDDVTPTGNDSSLTSLLDTRHVRDLLQAGGQALQAGTHLLQEGGRKFKDCLTESGHFLNKLDSTLPVGNLLAKPSAVKAVAVPNLAGINTSIPDVVSTAAAVTVVKDNVISDVYEAEGEADKPAKTTPFKRPDPPRKVYKKGVTDYQFNGSRDDVNGESATDASRDSGIDEQHMDLGKLLNVRLREHAGRVDPRKRWSEGEAFKLAQQVCADPPARKRWSTFVGPTLINLFDLLLDDKQRRDEQSVSTDSDESQVLEPHAMFTQRCMPPQPVEKQTCAAVQEPAASGIPVSSIPIKRSDSRLPVARVKTQKPSVPPTKPVLVAKPVATAKQATQVTQGIAKPTAAKLAAVPSVATAKSATKQPVRSVSPVKSANSSPVHKANKSKPPTAGSPQQSRLQSPRNSPVRVKYPPPSRPPPPAPKPKKSAPEPQREAQKPAKQIILPKAQIRTLIPPPKPARTMLSTEPLKTLKCDPVQKQGEPVKKQIIKAKPFVETVKPTVDEHGLAPTVHRMKYQEQGEIKRQDSLEDDEEVRKSVKELIKELEFKAQSVSESVTSSKSAKSSYESESVTSSRSAKPCEIEVTLKLDLVPNDNVPVTPDGPTLQSPQSRIPICGKQSKPASKIPGLLTRHRLEAGRPRSLSSGSPESPDSSLSGSSVSSQSSVIYNAQSR